MSLSNHSAVSATAAGVLFSLDSDPKFRTAVVQVTSNGTGCTISYEVSQDGVNWALALGQNVASAASISGASGSLGVYAFPLLARYFRARVSTYGSGTVTAVPYLREGISESPGVVIQGNVTTNSPVANGALVIGGTIARVKTVAGTNATLIKAGAGNIYSAQFFNNSAAAKFVKFYNKNTAPTVGTDTPAFTLIVPANSNITFYPPIAVRLVTGISYAITGAIADTDTTATAVDDVHGYIMYA